jgi:dihydropyrimidinase
MTALIIRGGTVVNHDHSWRADVLVDGETIVAIGSPLEVPARAQVMDAGGCYVMPGGIDAAHYRRGHGRAAGVLPGDRRND